MFFVSWSRKSSLRNQERRSSSLKVLGIDPGSISCGYGLVDVSGKKACYITSGSICPPVSQPLHVRLKHIYGALLDVIREHRPDAVVVEKIFFAKSPRAALSLGHARGIAILAAASEDVALHEFSALEVKKSVVGYGRAEKRQVQEMVKVLLNIRGDLYPDSADALALALCYVNTLQFRNVLDKSMQQERG